MGLKKKVVYGCPYCGQELDPEIDRFGTLTVYCSFCEASFTEDELDDK